MCVCVCVYMIRCIMNILKEPLLSLNIHIYFFFGQWKKGLNVLIIMLSMYFQTFFFVNYWLFLFDIFILCKIFNCLFPSFTCAVESWVEREASCKCWCLLTFFILNSKTTTWHVWRCITVYHVFPAWMKYCFQLCSDMKGNSLSLTSPAYFNPNFMDYDIVAVYRHFGGIISCQQVTLKCWKHDVITLMATI